MKSNLGQADVTWGTSRWKKSNGCHKGEPRDVLTWAVKQTTWVQTPALPLVS